MKNYSQNIHAKQRDEKKRIDWINEHVIQWTKSSFIAIRKSKSIEFSSLCRADFLWMYRIEFKIDHDLNAKIACAVQLCTMVCTYFMFRICMGFPINHTQYTWMNTDCVSNWNRLFNFVESEENLLFFQWNQYLSIYLFIFVCIIFIKNVEFRQKNGHFDMLKYRIF